MWQNNAPRDKKIATLLGIITTRLDKMQMNCREGSHTGQGQTDQKSFQSSPLKSGIYKVSTGICRQQSVSEHKPICVCLGVSVYAQSMCLSGHVCACVCVWVSFVSVPFSFQASLSTTKPAETIPVPILFILPILFQWPTPVIRGNATASIRLL